MINYELFLQKIHFIILTFISNFLNDNIYYKYILIQMHGEHAWKI